jgi:hypothetical protein
VLGFNSSFSVDRMGRSGGLAMFWQSSLNCQVFDYSQNHISLEIMDTDRGNWRLIGLGVAMNRTNSKKVRDSIR